MTHIPQPMQSVSEMKQIVEAGVTSIQTLPALLTGQDFLHSCLHFFGLHLSGLIIAILSFSSDSTCDYFYIFVIELFIFNSN